MRMPALKTIFVAGLVFVLQACETPPPDGSQWRHSESSYAADFSAKAPARLWDLQNNSIKYDWQNKAAGDVGSQVVAFADNGQQAATVEYDTILIWDIKTGEPLHRLTLPVRVKDVD